MHPAIPPRLTGAFAWNGIDIIGKYCRRNKSENDCKVAKKIEKHLLEKNYEKYD